MFGLFKKKPAQEAPPVIADRKQLVPRIKHINFLKNLQAHGVPPEQQPSTTPLCGELLVTYAFDLPDSFIMASPNFLAQAGVVEAEVAELALNNLKQKLPELQFFAKDGCGVPYTGEGLEATLLLVDSVWDEMQANFEGEILVVAAHRDRICICDSANPAAIQVLREMSQTFFEESDDQHRLSLQIMARRASGWALYEAH